MDLVTSVASEYSQILQANSRPLGRQVVHSAGKVGRQHTRIASIGRLLGPRMGTNHRLYLVGVLRKTAAYVIRYCGERNFAQCGVVGLLCRKRQHAIAGRHCGDVVIDVGAAIGGQFSRLYG